MSGVIDPGDAEARRWATVSLLLDVGLNPTDYGYGWAPPGRQAGG